METKKPNCLIIGSAKCGTTALASILDTHPDCCMSRPKEVSFFQSSYDYRPLTNFEKGWGWYKKAFNHYNGESVICDATPAYSDRHNSPETAKRIFEFNPEMRIIYMVRDPLARMKSLWQMMYHFEEIKLTPRTLMQELSLLGFESWMNAMRALGEWKSCCYAYQLEPYQELFERDQIYVSILENWKADASAEISAILSFLNLDAQSKYCKLPSKLGSAAERRVAKTWFRNLKNSAVLSGLRHFLPNNVKQHVYDMLGSRSSVTPLPIMSDDLNREFIEYIRDDIERFCAEFSIDKNFWRVSLKK